MILIRTLDALSSSTVCRCGRSKSAAYSYCWRCHVDHQIAAARAAAYQEGFADGRRAAIFEQRIDPSRVRQLLQLCHPDRHANSQAANDATRWLLEQRRSLEGGT